MSRMQQDWFKLRLWRAEKERERELEGEIWGEGFSSESGLGPPEVILWSESANSTRTKVSASLRGAGP